VKTLCWKLIALFTLGLGLLAPASLCAADAASSISLAGQWRFALDRDDAGFTGQWFTKDLTDKIQIPGILQGQGYGDDVAMDTPWIAALGVRGWQNKPELARFTKPGEVKIPWFAQPAKHYLGVAWYQRDIDIPANWAGKRVELFLERAHWQTTAFVDDKQFGYEDSLVAPHVSDLGTLTPGHHRLTIRVDNRLMNNQRVDGHSVSDQMGGTWNGLVGRIELHATSPVWIADAQVFPNVAKKTAVINVTIGNDSGQAGSGMLTAKGFSFAVHWDANGGSGQLTVPLADDVQTWDEFHPNLQHLTVTLLYGSSEDDRDVTFGLRELSFNESTSVAG